MEYQNQLWQGDQDSLQIGGISAVGGHSDQEIAQQFEIEEQIRQNRKGSRANDRDYNDPFGFDTHGSQFGTNQNNSNYIGSDMDYGSQFYDPQIGDINSEKPNSKR